MANKFKVNRLILTSQEITGSNNTIWVNSNELATKELAQNPIFNSTLTTNNSYQGEIISGLNSFTTINRWDAVYVNSNSQVQLANNIISGATPAIGLSTQTVVSGQSINILTRGMVRNDNWNWTPGRTIFLASGTGLASLTGIAPSTSNHRIQVIGNALNSNTIFLKISPDYFTVQ